MFCKIHFARPVKKETVIYWENERGCAYEKEASDTVVCRTGIVYFVWIYRNYPGRGNGMEL